MKMVARFIVVAAATLSLPAGALPGADGPTSLAPYGKPQEFRRGNQTVFAVWFADGEWHLRTTGERGGRNQFHGLVAVSKGRIVEGTFESLEKKEDRFVMDPGQQGFEFQFRTKDALDGLDFKVTDPTAIITFNLTVNGAAASKYVLVGENGMSPVTMPFDLSADGQPLPPPDAKKQKKSKRAASKQKPSPAASD